MLSSWVHHVWNVYLWNKDFFVNNKTINPFKSIYTFKSKIDLQTNITIFFLKVHNCSLSRPRITYASMSDLFFCCKGFIFITLWQTEKTNNLCLYFFLIVWMLSAECWINRIIKQLSEVCNFNDTKWLCHCMQSFT